MKGLLGYRSQRACVRALLLTGNDIDDVVRRTGLGREAARTIIKGVERAGGAEIIKASAWARVSVERNVLALLAPAAERRQLSEAGLVRALIATIAREPGLIGAVLDDGVGA